jgi:hypothetical protein
MTSSSRRAPRCRSRPQVSSRARGGSSAAARSAGRSAPRPYRSCRTSDPHCVVPTTSASAAHTRTACPGPRPTARAPATRCPVGSHATVTPANLSAAARVGGPVQGTAKQSPARPRARARPSASRWSPRARGATTSGDAGPFLLSSTPSGRPVIVSTAGMPASCTGGAAARIVTALPVRPWPPVCRRAQFAGPGAGARRCAGRSPAAPRTWGSAPWGAGP